jgi:hypothetical protein
MGLKYMQGELINSGDEMVRRSLMYVDEVKRMWVTSFGHFGSYALY